MPWSGSRHTSVAQAACDWTIGHRPLGRRPLRRVCRRIESSTAPNTSFCSLVERPVADPHGSGPPVAGEVVQRRLGEVPPAVDAVHDLEGAVGVRLEVADELHELVGLPVQVEVVECLEGEGRVAHPRVAVVPVALASRRLGQRRGEGGDRCPGRHVGQALDRQCRPLERLAVGVVGDPRPRQPGPPEAGRGGQAGVGLVDVAGGGEAAGPRQCAVDLVAGLQDVASPDAAALDAERHVGLQPDGLTPPRWRRRCDGFRPRGSTRRRAAVVEHRFADDLDLDLTVDAVRRPNQHVVGIVVGGRPRVRRDLVLALVRPHGQRVADDDPTALRVPRRGRGCWCRARRLVPSGR